MNLKICRIVGIGMELYKIKLTTTAASMNEKVASSYVSSAFKFKIPGFNYQRKEKKGQRPLVFMAWKNTPDNFYFVSIIL